MFHLDFSRKPEAIEIQFFSEQNMVCCHMCAAQLIQDNTFRIIVCGGCVYCHFQGNTRYILKKKT